MSLISTSTRRRQLPDFTMYVEITTTGMNVTCRVCEDRGSFVIVREIFNISKTKHRWFDTVELFFKVACEHYPARVDGLVQNVNKSGSL